MPPHAFERSRGGPVRPSWLQAHRTVRRPRRQLASSGAAPRARWKSPPVGDIADPRFQIDSYAPSRWARPRWRRDRRCAQCTRQRDHEEPRSNCAVMRGARPGLGREDRYDVGLATSGGERRPARDPGVDDTIVSCEVQQCEGAGSSACVHARDDGADMLKITKCTILVLARYGSGSPRSSSHSPTQDSSAACARESPT